MYHQRLTINSSRIVQDLKVTLLQYANELKWVRIWRYWKFVHWIRSYYSFEGHLGTRMRVQFFHFCQKDSMTWPTLSAKFLFVNVLVSFFDPVLQSNFLIQLLFQFGRRCEFHWRILSFKSSEPPFAFAETKKSTQFKTQNKALFEALFNINVCVCLFLYS